LSILSAPVHRFVFDTNTLVSALLLPTSIPRRALDYAFDHGRVLTSVVLLQELDRVLNYPKLAPYITAAERTQFLGKLALEGTLTTISVQLLVVRDPKDNFILELAVSGSANVIISGDQDLLTLGRYDGIPIRTPTHYRIRPNLEPFGIIGVMRPRWRLPLVRARAAVADRAAACWCRRPAARRSAR